MVIEMPKTQIVAFSGTTDSGFQYSIAPEALNDYELLENLCDLDNGDASKVTLVAKQILGEEQLKDLKEHLRDEKGRVPATEMINEITQIFGGQSVKNS